MPAPEILWTTHPQLEECCRILDGLSYALVIGQQYSALDPSFFTFRQPLDCPTPASGTRACPEALTKATGLTFDIS